MYKLEYTTITYTITTNFANDVVTWRLTFPEKVDIFPGKVDTAMKNTAEVCLNVLDLAEKFFY